MRALFLVLLMGMALSVSAQEIKYSKVTQQNGITDLYVTRPNDQVVYMQYNAEGTLLQTGFYKGSNRDGLWQQYDNAGNKIAELQYLDGCKHGTHNVWTSEGNLLIEVHYANGVIESATQYSKDGDVVAVR